MKKLVPLCLGIVLGGSAAQARVLFSPNADGVKDTAVFRIQVGDRPNIARWKFDIATADGKLLATFSGAGAPPDSLEWDGKDLNRRLVPDGTYRYTLSVWTKAGVEAKAPAQELIVDRVKPQVSVSVDPELFSPNADGVKDETAFRLSASDASGVHSWVLQIKDKDGLVVKHYSGEGTPPATLLWDGRTDFETDAPDGDYAFSLTVQDLAGNSESPPVRKVSINREAAISSVEASPRIFSPNHDGVKDAVSISIQSASPDTTESWLLQILNRHGKPVREFSGRGPAPLRLVWDGKNDKGQIQSDGPYHLVLTETDKAGNRAKTAPQVVELDNAAPALEVRLEPAGLSPNADGVNDEGVFLLRVTDEHTIENWALLVFNDVGAPMRKFSGTGLPVGRIVWKADDDSGKVLPDGSYTYSLSARDVAGNEVASQKQPVRIDRTPPVVSLAVKPELFSPNNDGILDTVTLEHRAEDASPLEFWVVRIRSEKDPPAGKPLKTFRGTEPPALPLVWDGKSDERALLPDGGYLVSLHAKDILGNEAATPPQKVTIGATRPSAEAKADREAFSPNADGDSDDLTFVLSVAHFNLLREWSLRILPDGRDPKPGRGPVRTFTGRGSPPKAVVWKGERDDQSLLPDGDYRYSLEVVDEAGNRTESPELLVRLDTARPEISASASPDLFSPNGDKFRDETNFGLTYRDASPCRSWSLEIRDETRRLVWKKEGKGPPPVSVPFSGETADGRTLSDGAYTYVFSAADEVGNRAATPEAIVRADNSPPAVRISAEPTLFSPDADGVNDIVRFHLEYTDASDIERWSVKIASRDPAKAKTFSGLGRPPRDWEWDGRGDAGSILSDGSYTAVAILKDVVGNEGKSGPVSLTIDTSKPLIQVVAEEQPLATLAAAAPVQETGRGLVISLAAEVLFDTGQAVIKSMAHDTLMRAAGLLKRYPNRKIRIEGHTDSVPISTPQFPNNQALSEARARSVLNFFKEKAGIPAERMAAVGFGETRPVASNATPEGRRQNRRVEIVLLKEGANR